MDLWLPDQMPIPVACDAAAEVCAALPDATEAWSDATCGAVRFQLVDHLDGVGIRVTSSAGDVDPAAVPAFGCDAAFVARTEVVGALGDDPDCPGATATLIALQALGHGLGVPSLDEPGHVMSWTQPACPPTSLTDADVALARAAYVDHLAIACSNQVDACGDDAHAWGTPPFTLRCVAEEDVDWSFGDGAADDGGPDATGDRVTHEYADAGELTVRATSRTPSACGTYASATERVVSCATPEPSFAWTVDDDVLRLTSDVASTPDCPAQVAWDVLDAAGASVAASSVPDPAFDLGPGDWRVVLNVGGATGTRAIEATVHVGKTGCDATGASPAGTLVLLAAGTARRRRPALRISTDR